MDKDYLTTGDVAKIMGCAPRTVAKVIDSGLLKGFRLPSSKDRRVPKSVLVRFLKDHGMPANGLREGYHVLLVGTGAVLADRLGKLLDGEEVSLYRGETVFEAGMMVNEFAPDVVVIDLSMGRSEGLCLARRLRSDGATFLVLANEDEPDQEALAAEFVGVFRRPFAVEMLAKALINLAGK